MKFPGIFGLAILGFIFTTFAYAQDHDSSTNSGFNIGEDNVQQVVTDKMIDASRKIAAQNANTIFHSGNDPVVGNPNGDMTFVEYMDFVCSHSREIDPNVQALIAQNPNLRIVYKEFPIHGEVSVYAAKAALAANKQGKYLPFHVALMHSGPGLSKAKVLVIAKKTGLNIPQLKTDMESPAITKQIESTHSLAENIGILGTPGLFFAKSTIANGDDPDSIFFMLGSFSQKELQQAINYIENK